MSGAMGAARRDREAERRSPYGEVYPPLQWAVQCVRCSKLKINVKTVKAKPFTYICSACLAQEGETR